MISIYVLKGADAGQRILLDPGEYSVGRDSGCDIRLFDEEVSRRHALIIVRDDVVKIVDLDSSNGTFVNMARIEQVNRLEMGDHIQLGQTLLMLSPVESEIPASCDSDAESRSLNASIEDTISISDNELSEIRNELFLLESPTTRRENEVVGSQIVVATNNETPFLHRSALETAGYYDPEQMLKDMLSLIFEWLPVDRGCILIFNRDQNRFTSQLIQYRDGLIEYGRPKVKPQVVQYVCSKRTGILLNNLTANGRWEDGESILGPAVKEAMCVPIIGQSTLHGVIYVDVLANRKSPEPARLGEEQLKLLLAIAQQASVTIDNVENYAHLLQSEKLTAIGQTLTVLSHHIKNILQSIQGGQHLIEHGFENDNLSTSQKGWEIVKRNQNSISNLVMDMLQYGSTNQAVTTDTDLNKVVGAAIEKVAQESMLPNLHFDWQPNPALPLVLLDPEAICTAVVNILRFCVESCRPNSKGQVFVRLLRHENTIEIEINDDGVGISDEELPRLFTPFADTDQQRVRGIGLAVSEKIIVQHSGQIEVVSKVGHGSNFSIKLPVAASSPIETLHSKP